MPVRQRAGFTLIEIATALVIISLLVLIGIPKFNSAMAKQNVRGARTMMVNMLAKARAGSTQSNRRTWLKLSGNRAWIIATPRVGVPIAGNTVDTLGLVENLQTRYGTTITVSGADSIGFDPRGISWSGITDTIRIAKSGYIDWVAIDGLGRVKK
jgi:prepilin-type N-terminal cleavage/methylation domain-containing protein